MFWKLKHNMHHLVLLCSCRDSWPLSLRGVCSNTNWRTRKSPIDDGAQCGKQHKQKQRNPIIASFFHIGLCLCVRRLLSLCGDHDPHNATLVSGGNGGRGNQIRRSSISHCPRSRVGKNKGSWMLTAEVFGNGFLGRVESADRLVCRNTSMNCMIEKQLIICPVT